MGPIHAVTANLSAEDLRQVAIAVGDRADDLAKLGQKLKDDGFNVQGEAIEGIARRLKELVAPQFGTQLALFPAPEMTVTVSRETLDDLGARRSGKDKAAGKEEE